MEHEAGLAVWIYGHSTVRRHFSPFWKQISYRTVSYHLSCDTVRAPHLSRPHPPQVPRPSRRRHGSSICLSQWQAIVMDHYQRRRGDPTFLHTDSSLPSTKLLLGSDGFRRGDTVLVSCSSCLKINGGLLDGSGDNEDHNRREIVPEEPHRCCTCMKSSRAFGFLGTFLLLSILRVVPLTFDDISRSSILVSCLMVWSVATIPEYSEMISFATASTTRSRS